MNIAIFNSHTLLASHYETELEIILNHQEQGDSVVQLVCEKDLPACDTNPFYLPEACERCVSKRHQGYSVLKGKIQVQRFFNLTEADKIRISQTPKNFSSIAELQQLKVDNFDVGYAVASSVISNFRDPDPVLDQRLIGRFITASLGVYFSIINYLKNNPTDIIYAFNGRNSTTKAVLRACNVMGVKCLLHERGNSLNYYSLFENTSIHDLKNTQRLIREAWNNADPVMRDEIATRWYLTRIGGKMENWFSFLADQIMELPESFDSKKENIIICNTSEDELASLGDEWKNTLYKNQTEGIIRIVIDGEQLSDTHFYLRMHPNLVNVDNADLQKLRNLNSPNLTIIPSASLISTYNLLNHCDKVITFGSTIGMEATFMGKPSILAGKSLYLGLGCAYEPYSHEELMQLLNQKLEPKPKIAALMISYFFGTFGIPFRHYVPEDFGKGSIDGIHLAPKKGFKYKLIQAIYQNKLFPDLSEKIWLRKREKTLQKSLP